MTDQTEFEGLVAVVTGGASGIGAATTARLRAGGATVAVLDRTSIDVGVGLSLAVDVTDTTAVGEAIQAVVDHHGAIDILVNSAGVGARGTVADNDDETWRSVLDVNVIGTARVAREAMPYLRHSKSASIVNIASIAATAGLPQRALYSASKGAILALTRAMAADHIAEGIRVNAVSPGTADTPWVERLLDAADDPAAERHALNARQPHGRLVAAIEVADAIAYLASPRSGSTTGTSIAVDGGMQELRLRQS